MDGYVFIKISTTYLRLTQILEIKGSDKNWHLLVSLKERFRFLVSSVGGRSLSHLVLQPPVAASGEQ